MKKKLFFLPALAALFFSSCSSDEPSEPNNGPEENGRFLAVNIISSGASGSRADEDNFGNAGFDNGDDNLNENKVESALFVFFDASGNQSQTPQLVNLEWGNGGTNPASDKISVTIPVVAGQRTPTSMLVILNPGEIRKDINGLNLTAAKNRIGEYSDASPFIMTNSSYYDTNTNKPVQETSVEGKVFESEEEATKEGNSVDVYVERIVAKVKTSKDASWKVETTDVTVGGAIGESDEITLKPEVQGIELANLPTTAYLFKRISGISTWMNTWPGVNDFTNKRSYWATTPTNYDGEYANQTWNQISNSSSEEYKDFNIAHNFYVLPNTTTQYTSVLITAILKDKDNNPVDLVSWGGNYYLKENFKNTIALFLHNGNYMIKKAENEYAEFGPNDVDYVTGSTHGTLVNNGKIKAYQTIGKVKDGISVVKKDGDTYNDVTATDIQDYLSGNSYKFELWEGGKCYYYKDIEHNPEKEGFEKGVIRNHVYDLSLTSLSGLGTPVVNPGEVIIPQKPDDKLFYVGAKVRILKWRVVPTQKVEFGK